MSLASKERGALYCAPGMGIDAKVVVGSVLNKDSSVKHKDSSVKQIVIQDFRIEGGLDAEAALLAERRGVASD
jgi:hypothetical protein